MKKKIWLVIIIILIIVGAILGYVVYDKVFKGDDDDYSVYDHSSKKESSKKEEEIDNDWETPKGEYSINLYQCGGDYISATQSPNCLDVTFTIKTQAEEAKVLSIPYGSSLVLYDDNGLKVYDTKTNKYKDLEIENIYDSYELGADTSVYGFIYKKDEVKGYYDLQSGKSLYEGQYEDINTVNKNVLVAYNYDDDEYPTTYVLSTNEEKVLNTASDNCYYYSGLNTSNGSFIIENSGCIMTEKTSIYTEDFQKIKEDILGYQYAMSDEGYMYIYADNKISAYQPNGKVYKSYAIEGEIKDVFKDIYLVVVDNKLMVKSYDGKISKELAKWDADDYYHYMISGYYDANQLENEEEKEAGYYFIVGKSASSTEGTEYYYNPETQEVRSWYLEEIGGYAKPVLYLYPEEETEVTVDFEHEENLTTTYPKFKDSWVVMAQPNGDLYDKDGKYYYGLYWEENSNHRVNFDTGFYVTSDDAIEFLEEKLSIIGLNERERNEFIMYWLPILEKNGQSLVYFELTEEREAYNKLVINPAPDSLLRVAIHVKRVTEKVDIKEEELTHFERKGFTAVEWGGVIYD